MLSVIIKVVNALVLDRPQVISNIHADYTIANDSDVMMHSISMA